VTAFAVALGTYARYTVTHSKSFTMDPVDLAVYRSGGLIVRQLRPLYNPHLAAPLCDWTGYGHLHPVCGPEVIDDVLAYLIFVQDTARRAKTAGLSPLEGARTADLGRFKDLLDAERIVGNLYRAYLELDGAERAAPVDLAMALGDMLAYNGGRPLTCHA
jgi:hypothetical protein